MRLPRLGQTMEQGILTGWLVDEGSTFVTGDPLYEVETDKMNTEVEAKQDGVLVRIVVLSSGSEIPVGTVLAVTADPAETPSAADVDAFLAAEGLALVIKEDDEVPASAFGSVPAPSVPGPLAAPAAPGEPLAVPAARHLARERGVDLATVEGSGEGGAVRVADLDRVAATTTVAGTGGPVDVPIAARIPVQGVGRAMADAMVRAWSVPQFTQQISVDATALVARLQRLRYEGVPVSYNDLVVAATAGAATDVPEVNATFADTEILRFAQVNVSLAMATERGLLVPVVRAVESLAIADLVATTKDLAERARQGRLDERDLTGGTITVSNLGAAGVDTGVPLLNAPQCALVFVGSLADRPVVVDGGLAVRKQLDIAIAYDHRVVDGMTASGFTRALRTRLEAGG